MFEKLTRRFAGVAFLAAAAIAMVPAAHADNLFRFPDEFRTGLQHDRGLGGFDPHRGAAGHERLASGRDVGRGERLDPRRRR